MGAIQEIVKNNDITTHQGFQNAMKAMKSVSDGEIHYILAYETTGQSQDFKRQYALAKAERDRRSFAEQKKLTILAAISGLIGVIIGALLQGLFNLFTTS